MISDPKVIARAFLSPFIGHRIVKNWTLAIENSAGWDSEKTIKHEKKFQFDELVTELGSDSILDERFLQLAAAFFSVFTSRQLSSKNEVSVLDIGGGYGKYFYMFNKWFPNITFDWTVVETESQCDAMPDSMKASSQIKFCSSIPSSKIFDICLMSGVIEYVEKPFDLITTISEVSDSVILNRVALSPFKKNYCAIQRPGLFESRGSYPLHLFSEDYFLKKLQSLGEISLRWYVPQDSPVVRFHHFPQQGLVFQPRRHTSV
jgi:putative methyltransferase (TIGR04325 family)